MLKKFCLKKKNFVGENFFEKKLSKNIIGEKLSRKNNSSEKIIIEKNSSEKIICWKKIIVRKKEISLKKNCQGKNLYKKIFVKKKFSKKSCRTNILQDVILRIRKDSPGESGILTKHLTFTA